jgi:hypothetical protein
MTARMTVAMALALVLPVSTGCGFAVKHPAATAGIVAGTLGFGTCKLASDSYASCLAVGGGAGAFLALIAAGAMWLGGDGQSVAEEEQAQPLPEADRPYRIPRAPAPAPDGALAPAPTISSPPGSGAPAPAQAPTTPPDPSKSPAPASGNSAPAPAPTTPPPR